MRFIPWAGAPRVLAAAMAALAMAAGVICAGAPAASASVKNSCTWRPLSLVNGWKSAQSPWNTGDPAYCVVDGTVYLSGSLTQPTTGPTEFAVLPPEALPASVDYLSVYTYAGTAGVLQIDTSGDMFAYQGKAAQFTSLAGISFPAAGTAMTPLTLANGWQSAQGIYGTGDPAYYTSGDITHLSGSLTGGLPPWDPNFGSFTTLPPGTSSSTTCYSPNTYAYGGDVGTVDIEPDGEVYPVNYGGTAAKFTTLTGIAFPQDGTAWQPLNLTGLWAYYDSCRQGPSAPMASYYISSNVVYLEGELTTLDDQLRTSATPQIAVLPPAARPAHDLYFLITEGDGGYFSLHIAPDGNMYIFGFPTNESQWTFLDGVSYPTSS